MAGKKDKLLKSIGMDMPSRDGQVGEEDVDFLVDRWTNLRPDLDPAAMTTLVEIERIVHHAGRVLIPNLEGTAVKESDFPLLVMVRRGRDDKIPVRVSDVWRYFGMAPSALAYHLNRLESAGIIRRVRSELDKRDVNLFLTDEGQDFIDRCMSQVSDRFLSIVSSDAVLRENHAMLNVLLARLVHVWERTEQEEAAQSGKSAR
ncbi:MAG: MarR family transcriptional regulator [Novosphingobium sp.]|nr:MarR family transcriptional regulator [Novosphingobium sp.]